jgi:hypothetical protein
LKKLKKKALSNAKISKAIKEANVIIEKQNYTKVNNFIKKYKILSNYYKSSNENLKKQLKNKLNILQKINKPMTPSKK